MLSHPKTSIQVCALGIIGGVCSGAIIILFRLGIETLEAGLALLSGELGIPSLAVTVLTPLVAVLGIISIAYLTGFRFYRLGIPFVIHRIKTHFGHIPLRTTINQFFGGMLALASGFVVGREGPSVHLGAASSSFMGQWLRLPYNSIRILAGCGIAAGISASFNTPLAAVIFVMEVVLREYRIHVFVPVMLSAACGSVMTRAVFDATQELAFFEYVPLNQWTFAYLIVIGIALGALATLFNRQLMRTIKWFSSVSMTNRLLLAGMITAGTGALVPHALGTHFEELQSLLTGDTGVAMIALLLAVKMMLAITAIGLGIPGGIIGPVMTIGMLAGVIFLGPLGWFADMENHTGTFALLGLAGMLTAVLHAPLAALTAVMELSYSPEIILPAMLVIVPAYVTSTQFFGNRSVFLQQLDFQKLSYSVTPVREALEKVGVLAAMESEFKLFCDAPITAIQQYLSNHPSDIVIQQYTYELAPSFKMVEFDVSLDREHTGLQFTSVEGLSEQSTLADVYDLLKNQRSGAVYIYSYHNPDEMMGLVTWSQVQKHLQQAQG